VVHSIATTLQICGIVTISSSLNVCVFGAQKALGFVTCKDTTASLVGGYDMIDVVSNFGCRGCELQKLIESIAA
jgi:hypothetical protein